MGLPGSEKILMIYLLVLTIHERDGHTDTA